MYRLILIVFLGCSFALFAEDRHSSLPQKIEPVKGKIADSQDTNHKRCSEQKKPDSDSNNLDRNKLAKKKIVVSTKGMVVSVSQPASDVGLQVLKQGGNAVDAAVATAFALAVTYPPAGNIGGGGFMMIHPGKKNATNNKDKRGVVCIDYRETAPAAATEKMYAVGESALSAKAVGVPGTVRGLALAHRRYGKLPWKSLVTPAVKLAIDGFVLDRALARSLNKVVAGSDKFPELQRVYGNHGKSKKWKVGDVLIQKQLAATLQIIANKGAAGFYEGTVADKIVKEMEKSGGIITHRDLKQYQAKIPKPVHGTFRGYDIYGPPPPSSGGVCLVQMLNVLENFELKKQGRYSPQTLHLMIETMRRAYADRARYLADADFVKIPPHLITKKYAKKLATEIDKTHATKSEAVAKDIPLAAEGNSTTHFSVVDPNGMAVSNTYTLEQSYGSRVVVRGAGFLLNNEMGDFNWYPGVTNRKGRIGTKPNQIAPGKRMLSSQTPTLVAKDGNVFLITGSPGGRTIINTTLNVLLNIIEFEMDLREAIDAPRIHHSWFPDTALFEKPEMKKYHATMTKLQQMGHRLNNKNRIQGDAHSILIKDGVFYGAADRRISGAAAGW